MSDQCVLEITDLVVEYALEDGAVHAVNHVDLKLHKGETLGLVGETGAGKTTIARSVLQILPEPPAVIRSGKITLDGVDMIGLTEKEKEKIRGNKVSMVFQDPMTALNPTETVGHQLAECFRIHQKSGSKEAAEKAEEMLELVGIPGSRAAEYPHQFSGGMKQRVVIAMALACRPEILIADEPTTALDVTIQAQVLHQMSQLRDELGTSVILITHDLGIVAGMCDSVAVIYAGEIVEYGSTKDVYNHTAHPYTQGLFDSLPSLTDNASRLKPIKGMMPDPTHLPEGCAFCTRCPFADAHCGSVKPAVTEVSPGHFVKCHKPLEVK